MKQNTFLSMVGLVCVMSLVQLSMVYGQKVKHRPAPKPKASVVYSGKDRYLKKRIDEANLIVVGRVVDIQPLEDGVDWQRATVQVNEVLVCYVHDCAKQLVKTKEQVFISFPTNNDAGARLELNQTGIFILFPEKDSITVSHIEYHNFPLYIPEQFQPFDNLKKIKKMIQDPVLE